VTQPATLVTVGTERTAQPRSRHESRPGRPAVVAGSLEDLTGTVHGTVELPIWMFWHPDRTFDLDETGVLRWLYQIVLREAASQDDLGYLNGAVLVALWPELHLPKGVREAWEDAHPELRRASVQAA
jgi:hypothetical protein